MHPDGPQDYGLWQTNEFKHFAEQSLFPEIVAKVLKDSTAQAFNTWGTSFHGVEPQQEAAVALSDIEKWLGTFGAAPKDLNERLAHYRDLLDRCDRHNKEMAQNVNVMPMAQYAKERYRLLAESKVVNDIRKSLSRLLEQTRQDLREATALARCCVWCGKDCGSVEARDEHEDVCGL